MYRIEAKYKRPFFLFFFWVSNRIKYIYFLVRQSVYPLTHYAFSIGSDESVNITISITVPIGILNNMYEYDASPRCLFMLCADRSDPAPK